MRIERRYRGPPDSGNGGYVAGMVANALGGSGCVVTLRRPPPLDEALSLHRDDAGAVSLLRGEEVIASAAAAGLDIDVPAAPPTWESAKAAEARFAGLCGHVFPGCFVCGPERPAGDGLRIFAGRPDEGGGVAGTWIPDPSLADAGGEVRPEFLWAALDCPGYFAVREQAQLAVLGRIGAVLHRPVAAGERLIVTGWPIGHDGRKHFAGTALHNVKGELVAAASAVWVTLAPLPVG